jgi:hypothetical protein
MRRKRRNPQTKKRERDFSQVDCPTQQKTYCLTYHQIDKGNGAEAKYDILTESHLHGWGPKLAARFFNMNLNNAYKIYCLLYKKHHGNRKPTKLKDCNTQFDSLTPYYKKVRKWDREQGYGAPPSATKDISSTSSGEGRRIRSDSSRPAFWSPTTHGTGAVQSGTPQSTVSSISARYLYYQQTAFNQLKYFQPGRNHLSVPVVISNSGRDCQYKKCPGWNVDKMRARAYYTTIYKCEQCTMEKEDMIFGFVIQQRRLTDWG